MVNYDIILNIISVVLLFIILFIILFGCRGRKYREQFTNNEIDTEKEEETKKNNKQPILSQFENNILTQLSNGSLSTEAFTDLIKKEKFTQDNLNNVIDYVEYFKGSIST